MNTTDAAAVATPPILFSEASAEGSSLAAVNEDGSQYRVFARPDGSQSILAGPDLGPDGHSVVFARCVPLTGHGNPCQLSTIKLDGTQRADLALNGSDPRWSPDGRRIAYRTTLDFQDTVMVANADGTDARVVARGYAAEWVDNRRLLFVGLDDRPGADGVHPARVRSVDTATGAVGGPLGLASQATAVAVAPSADRVAVMDGCRLTIMNVDGTGFRNVVGSGGDDCAFHASRPVWAPDGDRVALTRVRTASGNDPDVQAVVFDLRNASFADLARGVRLASSWANDTGGQCGSGYLLVASDGGVFTFGDATYHGSTGNIRLNQPIVAAATTPTGRGYRLIAADGGVFTFGDATQIGSAASPGLPERVTAAAPTNEGLLQATVKGMVVPFGGARYCGSLYGMTLNQPIVSIVSASQTPQS